jgi:hypothetical protein
VGTVIITPLFVSQNIYSYNTERVELINIYGWLFKDEKMRNLIRLEYDCYLWHAQNVIQDWWLSNMVHSLMQQLLHQEPVLCMLHVLARPDHAAELVPFPYPMQ